MSHLEVEHVFSILSISFWRNLARYAMVLHPEYANVIKLESTVFAIATQKVVLFDVMK